MKERGIIMSAPMVLALLEGRKTQTRRVLNPQPASVHHTSDRDSFPCSTEIASEGVFIIHYTMGEQESYRCPYGVVGDRLWVKEAWRVCSNLDEYPGSEIEHEKIFDGVRYPADGPTDLSGRYRHARWMPHWASRITLELTGVRVERLQDISEEDAEAEGVSGCDWGHGMDYGGKACFVKPYRRLWDSLHDKGAWDKNSWVWVLDFKKLQ